MQDQAAEATPCCRGTIKAFTKKFFSTRRNVKIATRTYSHQFAAVPILLLCTFHPGGGDSSQEHPAPHRRGLAEEETAPALDSFLGFSLDYHHPPSSTTYASTVHCVGGNFQHDAWMYRSCQFQNLCLDTSTHEFLFFPSHEELALRQQLDKLLRSDLITISSVVATAAHHNDRDDELPTSQITTTLSLGTIYTPPGPQSDILSKRWFPKVITDPAVQRDLLSRGYYQLPADTVLFPFQPSPTKLLAWNDIFSIYTVLSMFGLDHKRPVLIQHKNTESTQDAFPTSFLSVLGIQLSSLGSRPKDDNSTLPIILSRGRAPKSKLVCANYGAAGLGMIASTPFRPHNEDNNNNNEPIISTHWVSRGASLSAFRAYMLKNLGLSSVPRSDSSSSSSAPLAITVVWDDESAARVTHKDRPTKEQIHNQLELSLPDGTVVRVVDAASNNNLTLFKKLAHLAATSMVYITHVGANPETLAAATFLPHGAAFIVWDDDDDMSRRRNVKAASTVTRMERDFLENGGYFDVLWLRRTESDEDSLARLVDNVKREMDGFQRFSTRV